MASSTFADNFWGEKNNGFEVLLSNMKVGGKATTEFAELFREFAAIEDSCSKWHSKISRQIQAYASYSGCTLSPIWGVYKQFVDKLAVMHSKMANRYVDTMKQVITYSEEQHKRTKQIRDGEAATQEAVSNFQLQSTNLQKAREAYCARFTELERAKRDGVAQRDTERIESKLRKACEDYRSAIERYNSARTEFERRHADAARKLNEIEEQHLTIMCDFSNTFAESLVMSDTAYHECITQFRSQLEKFSGSQRFLLTTFVQANATGSERPAVAHFESPDGERLHDTALTSSSRNVSQSKDSLAKTQREFDRDSTKRESERETKRDREDAAVTVTANRDSPKLTEVSPNTSANSADSSSSALPRSTSAAFHLIRFDDSPTHPNPNTATLQAQPASQTNSEDVLEPMTNKPATGNEKGGKKEAAGAGSLANMAAAMSRGLMKTTNWVGASIKQSRHKPKGKLSVGGRPESVAGVPDGDLLALGSGVSAGITSVSSSSLKQSDTGAGAAGGKDNMYGHGPSSAIDDLLSIDFGASHAADAAQDDVSIGQSADERAASIECSSTKRKNESGSESSSDDDDDDMEDRAFRNIHVRIRPLDVPGVPVVAETAHIDALKASAAELKLPSLAGGVALRKKQQPRNPATNSIAELTRSVSNGRLDEELPQRASNPTNPDFVADFSQFEQRVADQERERATPTPSWVAFGHESADNTLVENSVPAESLPQPQPPDTNVAVNEHEDIERESVLSRPTSVVSELVGQDNANTQIGITEKPQADNESVSNENDTQFANFTAAFEAHFPDPATFSKPADSDLVSIPSGIGTTTSKSFPADKGSAPDAAANFNGAASTTVNWSARINSPPNSPLFSDATAIPALGATTVAQNLPSPISGKATPNSIEVANLIPPPLPAKSGRRVLTATLSSSIEKTELPTPPNSSYSATSGTASVSVDAQRPLPPARSRSAFGMTASSPVAPSRIITPPIMEDANPQDVPATSQSSHLPQSTSVYKTLPSRPLPVPGTHTQPASASTSINNLTMSHSAANTLESLNSLMTQSANSGTSSSSGGTLMSDSTHSAVLRAGRDDTRPPPLSASVPPPLPAPRTEQLSTAPRIPSVIPPAPVRHPPVGTKQYAFDVLVIEKIHGKFRAPPRGSTASLGLQAMKLSGVLSLTFTPAVVRELIDGSNTPSLRFRLNGTSAIDHIQVSKTLVTTLDTTRSEYEVNVPALIGQLRDQLALRTTASVFVIDCVKYQCQSLSATRAPLEIAAYWRCDSAETDYKIEYAFRPEAIPSRAESSLKPVLTSVSFKTTVSGGVQMMRPQTGTLDYAKQTATWRVADLSDSVRRTVVANWQLANGPSTCAPTAAQFVCENHSITEIDFEAISGVSFRLGSVRRSLLSGTYECDATNDANLVTLTHSASASTQQSFDAFGF